jgi:hypothetical protein
MEAKTGTERQKELDHSEIIETLVFFDLSKQEDGP